LNAEKFISMASARGIDFIAIAQQSTELARKDTSCRQRCGLRIVQLNEQPAMRAYGRETMVVVEPEWSVSDVGFALAGLEDAPSWAALYAWAGHSQYYWPLVVALRKVAVRMRYRHHWPQLIENTRGDLVDYIEQLCEMVLFDDQHPTMLDYAPQPRVGQDDQTGILRAIYCDVTLPMWKRELAERYAWVWGAWVGWLDAAARHVQVRLREEYAQHD
jgi:hypothetical protein